MSKTLLRSWDRPKGLRPLEGAQPTRVHSLTLSVLQLPITISFVMTCHKSQGRRLDSCVSMQLDPQLVACMLYFAASRSRTLEGFSMLHSVRNVIVAYANNASYSRFHAWFTRLHNATVRRTGAALEQDPPPEPLPHDLTTP